VSSFEGKIAVVTGGASGIGAESVKQLVARGASVMIADRDSDRASDLADQLGPAARWCWVDVTQPESVEKMVHDTEEQFGGLHVAVNSAGIGMPHPEDVGSMSFDLWRKVVSIDLDGVFLSMRYQLPAIERSNGGAIVNVSSILGSVAYPGSSAYVAAKHGVVGLTKSAALEYARKGVRVNAVGPGFIDTPLLAHRSEADRQSIADRHPVGRLGLSSEIASTIIYLASSDASFVTGTYIPVDGGYTAV
jgi:NAD(P)-dependent dehydrogenase (short-subunit alcohol dehydrogenase family)